MKPILALLLVVVALARPATGAAQIMVDVELVLAVDVSRSMTPRELEIQRRGYAEAIASDVVMEAILGGPNGRVAITYLEWAGSYSQRTVVGWTLIDSHEDARAFADRLTSHFEPSLRRTSISGAIASATDSFEGNGFQSLRRVIDVSGDGPNNQGLPVERARDAAVAQGIVINGLPLMTREGMGSQWHLPDLDRYYRDCVIGGAAAFVVPVTDWSHFPQAVRQKLVLELVHRPHPPVLRAQFTPDQSGKYDCLIGEKIWDRIMYDRY